ncbi:general stress protein 13 [Enterococcus sp. PF1-24]|uniref:CvfD/Ygs/GSP13 family RNA-binding post-transcriptional regulator n=1 Tax=unclassified Enterococcus TaxID=2608891 RepID=UPI002476AADC|nr:MULTISPECIES: CvfD/Ygs/GSP13 family RNA-binding post-transcriptional regulator [unclassified Enterococcus]MDH6365842.1 general stress protein 13 [Enterococcus sp. PFB1-1]MDH6402934.1 general stress protein 13 [Enterococcus sp. PF1-24]
MIYKIGDVIKGKVSGIQPYGAFISLDNEIQGLVHVSEVQSGYTKNIHDVLKVGEEIDVQIIDIDEYSQKISLSLRTLNKKFVPSQNRRKKYFTDKNREIGFESIEKQLPDWVEENLDFLEKNKA